MARDYTQLKADIASWTARSDTAPIVPTCIMLAEDEIARVVRVLEQETDDTLTCEAAARYSATLPDGFLGFKHTYVVGASNPRMAYVSPQQFHELNLMHADAFNAIRGNAGTIYTIEANKIKIHASAGGTEDVELDVCYAARFASLSDDEPTNLLLQQHYDLFLWGSLVQFWDWAEDTERVAKYQARFDRVVNQIEPQEKRKRVPSSPLVRRPPEVTV